MKSMLKICTLKMLLNFIVIVQEPWKASVSEVNQITPRDGTEPRALDVNSKIGILDGHIEIISKLILRKPCQKCFWA